MNNSSNITMSESAQIAVPDLPPRPQPLSIASQYWKILLCGSLCGLVLGTAYARTRKPTYTCKSTLLFPSAAPISGLAALAGAGGGNADTTLPLLQGALSAPQVGSSAVTGSLMVNSRSLEKQVIHNLKLWDKWKLEDYGAVRRRFEGSLRCDIGKAGEVNISFKDQSRELSYSVASEVVNELKRLTLELRLDPAADNVRFLEKKVSESKRKLTATQRDFAAYQKKYQLLDLSSQSTNLAQRYAELKKDALAAQLEADIATRQVALLSGSAKQMVSSSIDPSPITGNTLSPLYQRVKEAESQLALLRYQLTDDHPQVKEQKRILTQARKMLQGETSRQLSAVRTGNSPGMSDVVIQASASRARASGLKQAATNLAKEIDKLPNRAAGFMNLQAQVQANVQALALYQQELEKAKILTQSRGPVLLELDPPELPIEADQSHRIRYVLLGLLVGLGIPAILPYREWLRRNELYEDSRYVLEETRLAKHSMDTSELHKDSA